MRPGELMGEVVRRAATLRPSEARFVLDDALVMGWNAWARARFWTLPRETKAMLARNAALRDRHRGERCWILGNGPSLGDVDLATLRGEHTFVVNRFIHHPDAEALDPEYYVVVDPKFGAGAWGTDFVGELERRLPDVAVFTGPDGHRFLEERRLLARHARWVVYPDQLFAFGYPWEIDLTRGIPGMDNVTKTALCIAVWMGFTRIDLLGVDGNGLLLESQSHFYGHEPRPSRQEDLEKALVSSSVSLRGWRAASRWLADRGVELVSRSPRSALTALRYEPFAPPIPTSSGRRGASDPTRARHAEVSPP